MYLNEEWTTIAKPRCKGLTLTWDVFKLIILLYLKDILARLTLTWDVFKY